MDQSYSNTYEDSRKLGKHLSMDERGCIQALHLSNPEHFTPPVRV